VKPDNKGRASLISVITTPLGFFALALLIVEGFLGVVLMGSGLKENQKFAGMWMGAALFVLIVLIVTILVWKKPQHLTFSEVGHLEHDKMYGDQNTPRSATGLQTEEKIEVKKEPKVLASTKTPAKKTEGRKKK